MTTDKQTLLNDLQSKIGDFFRGSPVGDIERNVKALVSQAFQRLDLVTHEEFDIQADLIDSLRARITELERVVGQLDKQTPPG